MPQELKVADYYLRDLLRFPIEKTLFQHKIWDIFEVSIDTLFLGAYKLVGTKSYNEEIAQCTNNSCWNSWCGTFSWCRVRKIGLSFLQIAEEFDAQVQNALRNHLFTDHKEVTQCHHWNSSTADSQLAILLGHTTYCGLCCVQGTSAGFDLPASNIQRCRDHACPSWSDARKNFRLPTPTSWKSLPEFLEYPKDAYKIINTYGPRNLYNLDRKFLLNKVHFVWMLLLSMYVSFSSHLKIKCTPKLGPLSLMATVKYTFFMLLDTILWILICSWEPSYHAFNHCSHIMGCVALQPL